MMKRKVLYLILALIFIGSENVFGQKAQVTAEAAKVVAALKNKDMKRLSTFVHPTKGVRFSPYNFISDDDLVFQKSQIPSLFLLRRTYIWGAHDGSGDPINMGFPAYYEKFIYDKDFARAPRVSYNKAIGSGNTIINIADFFPKAKFVEYYFPGTRRYGGMDWRSLRLIFEQSGKRWYLVGISHDEWTI